MHASSSPELEFGLDGSLPLLLALLVDEFVVEHRNHLVGFVVGLPPPLLCTVSALVDRFALVLLLLLVFLDTDVAVHPIDLVLLALVGVIRLM